MYMWTCFIQMNLKAYDTFLPVTFGTPIIYTRVRDMNFIETKNRQPEKIADSFGKIDDI